MPAPFDAFGFIASTAGEPHDFVTTIVEQVAAVRFACVTVGSTAAFVAAEVDGLEELRDQVGPQAAESGASGTVWTMTRSPRFGMPVKRGRWQVGALLRAESARLGGAKQEIDARLLTLNEEQSAEEGFGYAAATVFGGDCQLIVDVGAPDIDSLFGILDGLSTLEATRVVDTALYQLDEGSWAER